MARNREKPHLSLRPQPPHLTPKPQTPARFIPARFPAVRPAPRDPVPPVLCASGGQRPHPPQQEVEPHFSAPDPRADKDTETLQAGTAPSLPPVPTQQIPQDSSLPSYSPPSLPPYSSSFQPTPNICGACERGQAGAHPEAGCVLTQSSQPVPGEHAQGPEAVLRGQR